MTYSLEPRFIAIEGCIGAGKTSLTELLAKHYNWEPHYEDVIDNPYLDDFYSEMERWSFNLQVYFLNSRFRQIVNIGVGPSSTMEEPLYVTNRDNVHFRKHPDIGSETLFLLERGEAISVKRVTPGEYQGSIEVSLGHDKNVNLDGWIYRSDVILLDVNNIFKKIFFFLVVENAWQRTQSRNKICFSRRRSRQNCQACS